MTTPTPTCDINHEELIASRKALQARILQLREKHKLNLNASGKKLLDHVLFMCYQDLRDDP